MTADKLRNALLYGEGTKEFYERMPEDAIGLATTSVTKHNEDARQGRHVRRFLIAAGAVA